jgi:hypothetical protein
VDEIVVIVDDTRLFGADDDLSARQVGEDLVRADRVEHGEALI